MKILFFKLNFELYLFIINMAFFKRVGTSTEKFSIKISVHSLKATFPATKKIFVKVKRGKKKA